jgi:hypothetical protein
MSDKSTLIAELQRMFGDRMNELQKARLNDLLTPNGGTTPPYENQTNPADHAALRQAIHILLQEIKYFKMSRPKDYAKLAPHVQYIMNQATQLAKQGNLDMARILLAGLLSQLKAGTIVPKEVYEPTEI